MGEIIEVRAGIGRSINKGVFLEGPTKGNSLDSLYHGTGIVFPMQWL